MSPRVTWALRLLSVFEAAIAVGLSVSGICPWPIAPVCAELALAALLATMPEPEVWVAADSERRP